MFSRFVVLPALWLTAVLVACTPGPMMSAPTMMPTRTAMLITPTPPPLATPPFADLDLDLTSPGWLHFIERYHNGSIATAGAETWELVRLQTDFEWEHWYRLDEAGMVVEMVDVARDMDGRALQITTYRDGISSSLTFNYSNPADPWPLPWTQPDFVWPSAVELVLAERVDALPPEAQALLDTEIPNLACDPLREADEAEGNGRAQFDALYAGWLESLTAQAQDPTPRWLHIVTTRIHNRDAFPDDSDSYPINYTNDQWLWLNEQGLVETSVGVMRGEDGQLVKEWVQRDGRAYDSTTDVTRTVVSQRPVLDFSFSGNAWPFVWLQREMGGNRDQLIFTACKSYNGGLPPMGGLSVSIVGGQRWLWVDAATGAILRSEWRHIDATGQSHPESQSEITLLEFVEELPPDMAALLEREMGE